MRTLVCIVIAATAALATARADPQIDRGKYPLEEVGPRLQAMNLDPAGNITKCGCPEARRGR
jgi:hypothetical protein